MSVGTDPSLRVADIADEAFLLTLYASTRADEIKLANRTPQQRTAFLEMQYNAQRKYYLQQYPKAEHYIVEQNRRPVGRMIVDRSRQAILLLHIALLPDYRNLGFGTLLVKQLLQEADWALRPVQLHIEPSNRAMGMYRRLGFTQTGESGIYLEMTRQPRVDVYA